MTGEFKKELASLLNRYSWDNTCETPDYILADYVESCLKNLCETINQDIAWHSSWKKAYNETEELLDKQIEATYKVVEENKEAKEIIRELVRVEYADFTNGDYSNELSKVLAKAEQFLKE